MGVGRQGYVELHCHSCFSFRDGASSPEELVQRACALGYPALALTDHDGLYGSMAFARFARLHGLQPITGAEVTLADGTHLTLLAETPRGYANLCRLITRAHLDPEGGGPPRLAEEALLQHTEGLIGLTGCSRGRLARLADSGRLEEALEWLRRLAEAFGRRSLFVELQQNRVYGDTARTRRLVELARRAGLPVVATNNVHYHVRERHRLQDTLVAIGHRTTLDASHTLRRPNSEFYLKPAEEMAELFAGLPEALTSTLLIAERCRSFDLTEDLGYTFPDFRGAGQEPADRVLERLCRDALHARYAGTALLGEAEKRLAEELRLIRLHGLAGFFLVYRDLFEMAREVAAEVRGGGRQGRLRLPPGRGRGSSVSSLVCYLIGLSHVDPVRTRLFLGRFLNDELHTVPDIDLDFPREIRERLIQRVYQRYGREHAALVCSFPTYQVRSALREIGKALGLPAAQLDRLAKLTEGGPAGTAREELARLPELRGRLEEPPWRDLVELAEQVAGFPRHVSQHVGGMVISSRPLVELVPVQPARMPGRFVCQWDKDSCEDARFIKIDFLALGALGQVEECLDLIEQGGKPPVDLSTIDYQDPSVYAMIQAGDTIGVFQIESRAQIQMLPRTRPENLEDLAVQVAIVRPGPIVGGAVNPYVRRREAKRRDPRYRPEYDHPLLEPVLAETLGVILYQDQVLQVCQALAGFTAGQAEGLRRAMSRRRSRSLVEAYWPPFREGARRKGVDEATARRVFEKIVAFSEFGFPKSHAAAFAVLAYQAAWLRRYYLPEFTAALLNNQPMGFYPLDVLIKDARRHGLEVRPPCVNRSGRLCTVEGEAVRLGLAFVKGIGPVGAGRILAARQAGDFRSLTDLVRRVEGLSREGLENLIAAGAFATFGLGERCLLWQLGLLMPLEEHPGRHPPRQGQLDLPMDPYLVALPDPTDWERMLGDYRAMELSPRWHPLEFLRPRLGGDVVRIHHLNRLPDGAAVAVAGLVVARQRPQTARGFVFLLLEDETGLTNVVIRPGLYEAKRPVVRAEPFVLVRGEIQRREGQLNLLAREIEPLKLPADGSLPGAFPPPPPAVEEDTREDGHLPDLLALVEEARLVAPAAHNFG